MHVVYYPIYTIVLFRAIIALSPLNRRTISIKRVLARQLAEEMKPKKITKTEMAIKMQTSRSQLDRLLDPEKTGVSIDTIQRAASSIAN